MTRSTYLPKTLCTLLALATIAVGGCVGARGPFGGPFGTFGGSGLADFGDENGGGGPGSPTTPSPGDGATSDDPCELTDRQKVVRISMRNYVETDYIHYFVAFVAFVHDANEENGFVNGAVCRNDLNFYRTNGYSIEVENGEEIVFGNFCIPGPALVYFHENGRFRSPGGSGTQGLASGIAPANGDLPTYDSFFGPAGAEIPVPNQILFHNPGTGEGAALKVSRNDSAPCSNANNQAGSPTCDQDAFYYVTEDDRPSGNPFLGLGSFRRVPAEIQGTGCQFGLQDPFQELAPPTVTAATASDQQFLRGARINYAFIRQDVDPPIPQLLWQVTDSRGATVHDFDPRANID